MIQPALFDNGESDHLYGRMLRLLDRGHAWTKDQLFTWRDHSPHQRYCTLGARRYVVAPEVAFHDVIPDLRDPYDERTVAFQAMLSTEEDDLRVLVEIIREQFPDRANPAHAPADAVTMFNDHDDTTWDDIEMVLEKAIVRVEEQA
jgi:hypothetical protein